MEKIQVLLIDDHTIIREALKPLLEAEHDIEVVGEAATGAGAIELIQRHPSAIVIMDITLPDISGLSVIRRVSMGEVKPRIILLTMHDEEQTIRHAVDLGINGYLLKQTAAKDLLRAVKEVNRGNAFFGPQICKALSNRGSLKEQTQRYRSLSTREVEILGMLVKGYNHRKIGEELCISERTVEKHRNLIKKKLDIHDLPSLIRYAIDNNLA